VLASDLAAKEKGQEAMISGDIVKQLSKGFKLINKAQNSP